MSTIRKLTIVVGADIADLAGQFRVAGDKADELVSGINRRFQGIQMPSIAPEKSGAMAGGAGQLDQLASAALPLASKIETSIIKAIAPLNSFAARFGAQFEAVGGTIIAISKKIDSHLKFPVFERAIEQARGFAQQKFAEMEGYPKRFAGAADKALGGLQTFNKFKQVLDNLGSVADKDISKIAKVKGGNFSFDASTKSIINLKGATEAATGSIKRMGGEIALALGAFGLVFKGVQFIKDGIKSASDLGETMSKVGTVFGDATDKVVSNSSRMAKSFGLPKGEILDAAASFGLIGKASGLNVQAAGKLANEFTTLAADVSSFYNIPLDQALEKLRSGLVGEAEPMRALGVLLSEDAVKAEAFRLGIAKSEKDLTDQAKVTARASLITKGLKDATGDLERTQDSASNRARKFAGSVSNLATDIGGALLPAVNKGLGLLLQFGTAAGDAFERNRAAFEGIGETIGSVFETAGILFRNWQSTFEIARLGIVQGLANLGEYFEVLGPNAVKVGEYIGKNWYQLIRDGVVAALTVLQNFGKNVWALGEAIGQFLADPTQGFQVDWTPLTDGFQATADKLPELIKPALTDMSKEIDAEAQKIIDSEYNRADKGPAKKGPAKRGVIEGGPSAKSERAQQDARKELDTFAKSLKDRVQSPLSKYFEEIRKIDESLNAGLIGKKDAVAGKLAAFKETGLGGSPQFAGALEAGSQEARSTILAAMTGRDSGIAGVEKNTATIANQMATALGYFRSLVAEAGARAEVQVKV